LAVQKRAQVPSIVIRYVRRPFCQCSAKSVDFNGRFRYDSLVDRLSEPPDPSESAREELPRIVLRDLVCPAAVVTIAGLAMVPLPRLIVWIALAAVPGVLGYYVTRPCGIAAAATSCLLYLWAHGDPRFASTITDQWTIRCAFLLALVGALGACAGDWRRRAATSLSASGQSLHRR
jgi:hypothetical protein